MRIVKGRQPSKRPRVNALGKHYLAEFFNCDPGTDILSSTRKVHRSLVTAANKARAKIVEKAFHKFEKYGVSGAVVIAESHLTVHTWPEYNYAAIDIFACGSIDIDAALDYLAKRFGCKKLEVILIYRGVSKKPRPHKPAHT